MLSFFFFRFRVSASLSGVVEVGTRRGEDSSSKKFAVEPRFEFFFVHVRVFAFLTADFVFGVSSQFKLCYCYE